MGPVLITSPRLAVNPPALVNFCRQSSIPSKKSVPRTLLQIVEVSMGRRDRGNSAYALNELPQPQVDFTLGLLNLNPEPSSVST